DGRYFILDNFNKILSTSIDTMKTWESHYATGEDNIDILFGHLNGKVYAASSEKTGLYVYGEAPVTRIDSEVNTNPERIQLEQNYPKPFNPSTTIRFSLNKPSFVSLEVFDVLGNRVKQLVEANLSTGKHEVQFDANQLSSGLYFYRLQVGNFVETKKMLLSK
ncbi:MAG: T9SS type A sorting domain-containing protein, partial [Bacteroidetes bacterium]|nr:T9SS type A sorting domain-containing protein [Bacteroidota bacterium]